MSYNTRKKLKGTFFILPAFLIHVIVIVIPALSMIYYAFTKWNGLSEPVFIGLDNFKRMLKDYDFLFDTNIGVKTITLHKKSYFLFIVIKHIYRPFM